MLAAGASSDVMFADRDEAGRLLGEMVRERVEPTAIVLGVPRGGVVVAVHVASALGAPLDVVVPRKLGAPGNPELGIGAVAPGVRVVDRRSVQVLGVDELGKLVVARIQAVEGITRTLTCPVVHL